MRNRMKKHLRRTHRYLGLFVGIQFLLWTIGGLYFSWSDIGKIHGDHLVLVNQSYSIPSELLCPTTIIVNFKERFKDRDILKFELIKVLDEFMYLIYDTDRIQTRISATTGRIMNNINELEARAIAKQHLVVNANIDNVRLLTSVGNHHEYRRQQLPVWAVSFNHEGKPVIYINAVSGQFERIRHSSWRIFDWLWMLHTMDYITRDNFGNWLL